MWIIARPSRRRTRNSTRRIDENVSIGFTLTGVSSADFLDDADTKRFSINAMPPRFELRQVVNTDAIPFFNFRLLGRCHCAAPDVFAGTRFCPYSYTTMFGVAVLLTGLLATTFRSTRVSKNSWTFAFPGTGDAESALLAALEDKQPLVILILPSAPELFCFTGVFLIAKMVLPSVRIWFCV
jgi:hypothetical protein